MGIWLWRPVGLDYRTSTGPGRKESLGGHKQNLVCTRSGERKSDPKRDLVILNCECPGVSSGAMDQQWPITGPDYNSPGRHSMLTLSLLKEITIGLRPSYREGTESYPLAENWTKDLLSMAPPIRTRLSFPHSQSIPSGSFHKPLILVHQRVDRKKKKKTQS